MADIRPPVPGGSAPKPGESLGGKAGAGGGLGKALGGKAGIPKLGSGLGKGLSNKAGTQKPGGGPGKAAGATDGGKGGLARNVTKEAAKGAIKGGGLTGAVQGAGKALLNDARVRKALVAFLALIMAIPLIELSFVSVMAMVVFGKTLDAQGAQYQTVSAQGGVSSTNSYAFFAAAKATGIPWTVPSAITYYESGPGKNWGEIPGQCSSSTPPAPSGDHNLGCPSMPTKAGATPPNPPTNQQVTCTAGIHRRCAPAVYVGPMQIDQTALPPGADATSLTWSATWLMGKFKSALQSQPHWSNQLSLADGVVFYQSGALPVISNSSNTQKTVRADYLAALATLPVKWNTGATGSTFDTNVYELLRNWYIAATPATGAYVSGGGLGLVCGVTNGKTLTVPTPGGGTMNLAPYQLGNAAAIVHEAQAMKVPQQGMVVAIMVGLAESTLTSLPNANVPGSESNPLAQWGGYSPKNPPHNYTSVGIFQQLNSWGTVTQRLTPSISAGFFFQHLMAIPNWQSAPPGKAAQEVQGSANPTGYAPWQPAADVIVGAALKIPCNTGGFSLTGATPQGRTVALAALAYATKPTPYVWGGGVPSGPSGSATAPPNQVGQPGFDCSGLALYAFAKVGISLPHYTVTQFQMVQNSPTFTTNIANLKPGDLVFFGGNGYAGTPSAPGHVGIYLGNGKMVNAPYTGKDISVASFTSAGFVGGGWPS